MAEPRSTMAPVATFVALAIAVVSPLTASAQPVPSLTSTLPVGLIIDDQPAGEDVAAPAQSPRDRAKVKVQLGTDLYEKGQYEEALAGFQDAASLYASPDFQFNIGLCHERLGNYTAAIVAFETYLRNKPEASDRISVEGRIRDIKERVELEKRATAVPVEVEPEPKPEPNPEPVVTPPNDAIIDDGPTPDGRDGRGLVIAGSVLLGVGILTAAGGGVAFGVLASSPTRSVESVLNAGNPQGRTFAETQDLAEEADRYRTGQYVSLAVGGALATAGLVTLLLGTKRRRQSVARMRVLPSMGGVTLSGTF